MLGVHSKASKNGQSLLDILGESLVTNDKIFDVYWPNERVLSGIFMCSLNTFIIGRYGGWHGMWMFETCSRVGKNCQ